MPRFSEFEYDNISLMVDPFTGRVALMCPAPIISFDDVKDFSAWITSLLEAVPILAGTMSTEDKISKDYAETVINLWQNQILEQMNLPKAVGRKKSGVKPKNSMEKEQQSGK